MPLNREFIGRVYPPTAPYEVGRERIREFATAVGDTAAAAHEVAAARALGYDDLVAPPTFPITLSMRAEEQATHDPALGLDFSRVVHRQQEFVCDRPVLAGDVLTVVLTVIDVDEAGGNDVVTTLSEIRTVAGERVCTATSTMVARA